MATFYYGGSGTDPLIHGPAMGGLAEVAGTFGDGYAQPAPWAAGMDLAMGLPAGGLELAVMHHDAVITA